MPNQTNQPKITDPSSGTSAPIPDFQNAMDIPPIPENATTPTTSPVIPDSAAPSDLPPVIPPTPKKKFGGGRIIATILGILLLVGGIGTGVYLTRQNQSAVQPLANILECFPAGTKITLDNGTKVNIEDIKAGDKVLSQDPTSGKKAASTVQNLLQLGSFNMCNINFTDKESLKVTNPHPLYTQNGWRAIDVPAAIFHNPGLPISQLIVGDFVAKEDGTWKQISSISCTQGGFKVYNLTVDNNHDFFAEGFLAHNKAVLDKPGKTTVLDDNGKVIKEIDKTTGEVKNFDPKTGDLINTVEPGGPSGNKPAGTYPVYGADGTTVTGYRYIQAAGVFEGAISRAAAYLNGAPGSTADDTTLLQSQYGMGTTDIKDAQSHIAAGETWAPPGVGGIPIWHWTTCTNEGSGMSGIGCDVVSPEKTQKEKEGPTPTPSPTASCQNIKAYSSTWVLLTSTQLSQLGSGSQVNFCVVGAASNGVFDMARFTINGVLKPNTTTKRPGTSDYCQNFTIPPATTTFNVSAQIHHTTLGWK